MLWLDGSTRISLSWILRYLSISSFLQTQTSTTSTCLSQMTDMAWTTDASWSGSIHGQWSFCLQLLPSTHSSRRWNWNTVNSQHSRRWSRMWVQKPYPLCLSGGWPDRITVLLAQKCCSCSSVLVQRVPSFCQRNNKTSPTRIQTRRSPNTFCRKQGWEKAWKNGDVDGPCWTANNAIQCPCRTGWLARRHPWFLGKIVREQEKEGESTCSGSTQGQRQSRRCHPLGIVTLIIRQKVLSHNSTEDRQIVGQWQCLQIQTLCR